MEFSGFTFILTTDCNFHCSYCYQKAAPFYLDVDLARDAADFFFPYMAQECSFNFYGGEPLLAFDVMEEIIACLERQNEGGDKRLRFSITTNGSLIDQRILQFLDSKKFSVLLSFDGTAQDSVRKPESSRLLTSALAGLRECRNVDLATNSVFTPETVGTLADSVSLLLENGVTSIDLSYSCLSRWDEAALSRLQSELSLLRKAMLEVYQMTGTIPVSSFRRKKRKGHFLCSAGRDRMALSPEGLLWGCCFFYDFVRSQEEPRETGRFSFGSLRSFKENPHGLYEAGLKDYANLSMNYFFTKNAFCQFCEDVSECSACPAEAALASKIVGMLPEWACPLRKIIREERRRFWAEAEG